MVEKVITVGPSVIDFARYRLVRAAGKASSTFKASSTLKAHALSARTCRHCNATLAEGENEDECSGALGTADALDVAVVLRPRKFYVE